MPSNLTSLTIAVDCSTLSHLLLLLMRLVAFLASSSQLVQTTPHKPRGALNFHYSETRRTPCQEAIQED